MSDYLQPCALYRPPGSSVHGTLQERILEWVAISSFKESFQSRDRICVSSVTCIGRQILYDWATWEAPKYSLIWGKTKQNRYPVPRSTETLKYDEFNQRDPHQDIIIIKPGKVKEKDCIFKGSKIKTKSHMQAYQLIFQQKLCRPESKSMICI